MLLRFAMLPILVVVLGLAASALGYPTAIPSGGECPMKFKRQTPTKPPATFDAAAQAVNVTGANAFVPPTSTDLRGPCPGMLLALDKRNVHRTV